MEKVSPKDLTSSELVALLQVFSSWTSSGGAVGDLLDIPSEQRDALYQLGHGYYVNGRYDQAFQVFSLLVVYEHLNERYLMAAAGAAQMLGKYKEALQHYYTAAAIMIDDPRPVFFSAECLLALGENAFAIETLELTIELAGDKTSEISIKTRAQAMLQAARETATVSTE